MKTVSSIVEWYGNEVTEVLAAHRTKHDQGLSSAEVIERNRKYGRNVQADRKGKGPFFRFLLQFHQPLICVLLIASAVTACLKEPVDASVILGVVLLNAIIGFV